MAFIENACATRYSGLWEDLRNRVAIKLDKYPKTLSEATYLLTHYKSNAVQRRNHGPNSNNTNSQFSFHQGQGFQGEPILCQEITDNKNSDGTVKGTDGQTCSHVQCHNWQMAWTLCTQVPCTSSEQGRYVPILLFHF